MIELRAGKAHCTISPDEGGRIASLRVANTQLLVERPLDGSDPDPMSWGCYPMAPWAGRIRHGRFNFRGVEYHLAINLTPHAIHGTVFTRAWHVDLVEDDAASMSCTFGPTWPLGGFVTQRIELHPDSLVCELTVTATNTEMPAQVGWHPWFVKPHSASLAFANMYARDREGIPTGTLVTPHDGPWDDCFTQPLEPLELRYRTAATAVVDTAVVDTAVVDTAVADTVVVDTVVVTISSDCDHWTVYDQPHHATCVEPQSGPPDGFNLEASGAHSTTILGPGEALQRSMRIGWREVAEREPESTPD